MSAIKTKEHVYTEIIHRRSRRAVHSALRRSAGDADTGAGSRRLASNNTISAARAMMVTKKNQSLLTMGPMIAISRFDDGIKPVSESSCKPEMNNWAATKKR